MDKIRNFSVIAHVDHGKSTLSDRLLEFTNTVEKRNMKTQFLDSLSVERERGITIKLRTVRMQYKGYTLNLIDTPGHVDFSSEVLRSLQACEGAILLIDVTGGIEAQTIGNFLNALSLNLDIIPVLNKVDVANIDIDARLSQIHEILGFSKDEILKTSGKTGLGVYDLLDSIIAKISPPKLTQSSFRGFVFDSFYDHHLGEIILVKVTDGTISRGDVVYFHSSSLPIKVIDLGYLTPEYTFVDSVSTGEVCFLVTKVKSIKDIAVKDTLVKDTSSLPVFKYERVKSMIFSSFFPLDRNDTEKFKEAIEKLGLNDFAFEYSPVNSIALGFGYKCGFLGILHMEVVSQRLSEEYGVEVFVSSPTVEYKLKLKDEEEVVISNPLDFNNNMGIDEISEPYIKLEILSPQECMGSIIDLVVSKRGVFINSEFKEGISQEIKMAFLSFEMPLSSLITDFYDKLQMITSGRGSMDYSFIGYRASDIVRVDFLVNKEMVEPLSMLCDRSSATRVAASICSRLKNLIPKSQFTIAIQAVIEGKITAREDISSFRKDVTAKLYGGDPTRRMKLLEKQKKGKARAKTFGKVEIPQDVFVKIYKV